MHVLTDQVAAVRNYRHIIWDWNGTLFDDAWLCVEIINDLLGRRRMPLVTLESYQQQFTFPVKDYYRALGFDFDREPFEVLAAEYVETYDRRRFECRLQPDAFTVLNMLRDQGLTQSILSAYEHTRLAEMADSTGIRDYFHRVIGLNDYYAASKVDLGRQFLAELACCPRTVVLIGDTLHDAEVAAAVGIDCLLIPSGHQSRQRLESSGLPVVASLSDLLHVAVG